MLTVTELLAANLHGVFGATNESDRHREATLAYAPDVVFIDSEGTFVGIDEVEARAKLLSEAAPEGWRFVEDGPVYTGPGSGALAWALGPENGEPVVRGVDLLNIEEGKITRITTLIAQSQSAAESAPA